MTKVNGGTDPWNVTGVYWSQFTDRYPMIEGVNDVALFDLIEIPEDLVFVLGETITLRIKDDGSFGGHEWRGLFGIQTPIRQKVMHLWLIDYRRA